MDQSKYSSKGGPHVRKPTRVPYMNFTQDFLQTYRGEARAAPDMMRLAGQRWRGMSEREKAPYVAIAQAARARPQEPTRRVRRVEKLQGKVVRLKAQLETLRSRVQRLQSRNRRTPAHQHSVRGTPGRSQPRPTRRSKPQRAQRRADPSPSSDSAASYDSDQ